MTPKRWQQIDQLFKATLTCEPGQRKEFLAAKCNGDEPLRREVESLLTSLEEADEFMETSAGDVAAELLGTHRSTYEPGHQIQNYQIVRQLGSGGMGEVYLAEDIRLTRKVALKLLPPHFTVNPDRVRRFEREARAASALNHPNIVTIYEIGHSGSTHFIATEFVDGKTLRQLINEKPFTLGETLNVSIQIADALSGAHAAGIVHRDVKPENIMIRQDGYVKILDFGLAKLTEQQTTDADLETPTLLQTNPGLVMGTVQYMSPEQARAKNVGMATDIWSLGIVMYELLAGHVPFSGETPSHVMVSLMENRLPRLRDHAIVPDELDRFVTKALRKNQKERYQTAVQLARDLRSLKQKLQLDSPLNDWLKIVPSRKDGLPNISLTPLATSSGTHRIPLETRTVAETVLVPSNPTSSVEFLVGKVRRHKQGFLLVAAMLMVAIIVGVAGRYSNRATTNAIDSVAVLPFANVGNDESTEYLSDGISDSIINSLSESPGLKVISLNAALRYKAQQVDPQRIGLEFNVQAVLMGRLTQQGDKLLISAELVDVRDNRRLWGEQYTRKLSDILVVQREISQQISSGLRLRLSGKESKQIAKQDTENSDAYNAYLKGRYFLHKRRSQYIPKGIEHLEEAVRLDPNYALAHATLAHAYLARALLGPLHLEEVLAKAKEAVEKALTIDDTLAEAHAVLGGIRFYEWDWSGAEREFKRAIELNPNFKSIDPIYQKYLVSMKRYDEAVAESKRVLELDPVSPYYNRNVGMILYFARRYDEAIEQLQRTVELEPDMGVAWNWLWRAYEQKGQYDQAVEAFLKFYGPINQQGPEATAALREVYAKSGWKGFWLRVLDLYMEQAERGRNLHGLAENYARLGERDQALFWLEKAVEQRDVTITSHCRNPVWDGYRSDPRFANLIRRMGLEP